MNRFKHIDELFKYLDQIPKFQTSGVGSVNYSLDNIRSFCEQAGNIHLNFASVHVAGTNGKGTTSSLIEWVYRNSGIKTGLFTSPHLLRYNERVKVNGEEIRDSEMLNFFNEYLTAIKKYKLSYFEISTALAFWYFSKKNVELAVIETGLGGRLDATNIIEPELSVITSISLDHTDILGNTIEEIAAEKAGIIKRNRPVVVGKLPESALKVINKVCKRMDSPSFHATELRPDFYNGQVSLESGSSFQTNFIEPVNKWNVAMTILVCRTLQDEWPVGKTTIRESLENFKGVSGRFEKLSGVSDWYFSGAHNEEALLSSLQTIREISADRTPVLFLSLMKDKVNKKVTDLLNGFGDIYYVAQEGSRAASIADMKDLIDLKEVTESNYESILNELKTSLVIFAGSFYFYPIVKRWISQIDQNN
ncbi:bifunctional folylpolyglutamate synthase/dihydrofolate synthase [Balneola sp. MJW-20]|uniref:bifunctional folylpolyglutamate synthase/dihydrofolate synthase n=1 Tax=Gracilimonas aurantiaca TaxID=3234185 RepID=UPI00346666F6